MWAESTHSTMSPKMVIWGYRTFVEGCRIQWEVAFFVWNLMLVACCLLRCVLLLTRCTSPPHCPTAVTLFLTNIPGCEPKVGIASEGGRNIKIGSVRQGLSPEVHLFRRKTASGQRVDVSYVNGNERRCGVGVKS